MKPKQQVQIRQMLQKQLLSSQRRRQQQHQVDKHTEPVVTLQIVLLWAAGTAGPVVPMCSAQQRSCS